MTSSRLTLPDNQYTPSNTSHPTTIQPVPTHITSDLGDPILDAGLGDSFALTAGVLMPEAPMYKDGLALFRENEVRLSWKSVSVKPVPEAHSVNEPADDQLRSSILRPDPRHVGTALRLCEPVCHLSPLGGSPVAGWPLVGRLNGCWRARKKCTDCLCNRASHDTWNAIAHEFELDTESKAVWQDILVRDRLKPEGLPD